MIDLEFYVNAMPSSSGFPKAQMVQYLQQMQQRQREAAQQQAMIEQQMQGVPTEQAGQPSEQEIVNEMLAQSTPDVNAMVDNMSEEEKQMAMQNPKMLEDMISNKWAYSPL
jgi:hypothetical protein